MKRVRTRFAPSPTGALHIGGVRTALYCYLFAKKNNGDFILRIEDTDKERTVKGAEEYIIKSLEWLNIKFDEGPITGGKFQPYRQSERKDIYKKYAELLIENGNAYYAFDTPDELEKMRKRMINSGNPTPQYNHAIREYMKNSLTLSKDEVTNLLNQKFPFVIRAKMPRNLEIKVFDQIRGWVIFNSSNLDDKVLFKSDGMPTYHLANVVDDYLMKITHVIRGEEWLPSLPLHHILYDFFGWQDSRPEFAHLPLLLKPDGKGKLSKRDGQELGFPVFPMDWDDIESGELFSGFKQKGFYPEALLNFLLLLGWNPGTSKEVFTMKEMIEEFTLERVGKSGAKFDYEKAKWFNQLYLRNKSSEELVEELYLNFPNKTKIIDKSYLLKVCELMKERAYFTSEILEETYLFNEPQNIDINFLNQKKTPEIKQAVQKFYSEILSLNILTAENSHNIFNQILTDFKLKIGQLMPILRMILTGKSVGPPLFKIIEIIGKSNTLSRLQKGINILKL